MNKKEKEAYSYFIQAYQRLRDLNEPYRSNFDEYDKFYRGYRDDNKYPFAYNYSFNKIIPIIYTVLSRFMGQLYQASDIVVVKPRKSQDVERAELVSGVLNYQLNNLNDVDFQGGSYMVMLQWFLSAMIHGKGIVRAYWRKEERTLPKRTMVDIPQYEMDQFGQMHITGQDQKEIIRESMQTVYDGPYVENIPVRNFLPDPEYRSIQKMPAVAHLYTKSMSWLKAMQKEGVYKNIGEVGQRATKLKGGGVHTDTEEFKQMLQQIENAYTIDEIESDRHKANNVDIIDIYGKYDLNGNGKEEEVVCTIANYDTVIKLEPCKYGVKPFFDIGCHINTERYWDIGMIELVKDVQESYNDIANLRLQNSMMKVNTMIKVLIDSEVDPRALVWKPFGIIPVEDMNEVQLFDSPDYSSAVFEEQIGFFERVIQDITGIYDYAKGVTPSRHEAVGTMASVQQVAEARIKLLLMTMDYMGIRPLLKYMMVLNTYNLPSGFEFRLTGKQGDQQFGKVFGPDLHVDYDFEAKYAAMEPALTKEYRVQQLLQYAQLWQQDPEVNNFEFKTAILEMMDFPQPERFLKDPEEVAKEKQENEMKQLLPMLGQAALQAKMQQEKNQVEMAKALLKS